MSSLDERGLLSAKYMVKSFLFPQEVEPCFHASLTSILMALLKPGPDNPHYLY